MIEGVYLNQNHKLLDLHFKKKTKNLNLFDNQAFFTGIITWPAESERYISVFSK